MTMFASLSCSVCHYLAENCNQRFAAKLRQLRDVPFFIPPFPPTCSSKNDCNPNPQIFVGILWKVKPEGFALCRQLLRKKSTTPPQLQTRHPYGEGCGQQLERPSLHHQFTYYCSQRHLVKKKDGDKCVYTSDMIYFMKHLNKKILMVIFTK